MAWCRQATSHYLGQYWPRSPMPYGVTRPQWVIYQHWLVQKNHIYLMFPENNSTPHWFMIPPTIYIYDAVKPMPVVLDHVLNVMAAWVNTHHMGLCVGLQWMMWRQEQPNTGQEYLNIVQQWCAGEHAEHDHIAWQWGLKFIFTYADMVVPIHPSLKLKYCSKECLIIIRNSEGCHC